MKNIFLVLLLFISCSALDKKNNHEPRDTGFRIAVVNFKIVGGQSLEKHIKRIEIFAEKAKSKDALYLVLPELTIFDLLPVDPEDSKIKHYLDELSEQFGKYEKELVKISIKHKLSLIGASAISKEKGHYINRAFYISRFGKVSYQDKVQPTPWESKYNFKGGSDIHLFTEGDFSFSILICHDSEFPTLSSQLIKTRPEVIFVPSQTDDSYGLSRVKFTSMARAIEHMSYVVMTGDTGLRNAPWHTYIGQSFLFTPQNKYFPEEIYSGEFNEEELTVFQVDIGNLRSARKDLKQVYPARDVK